MATDGTPDRLHSRLGAGFLLLLVAPGTAVWSAERWLGAGLMPRLAEVAAALPVPAEVLVTEAYPGAGPHTVLLIRPDGHLVGVTQGAAAEDLQALADGARGGPASLPGGPEQEAPASGPAAPGAASTGPAPNGAKTSGATAPGAEANGATANGATAKGAKAPGPVVTGPVAAAPPAAAPATGPFPPVRPSGR